MFNFLTSWRRKGKTLDQIAAELDGFRSQNTAGQRVNTTTAVQVSAVLACVRVLADSVSVPDLKVMRDNGDGTKLPATSNPAYNVLLRRPNEFQNALEFREMMQIHLALTGNAMAVPTFFNGRLVELLPVMPHHWTTRKRGRYDYVIEVSDEFGKIGTFSPSQVFHLKSFCWEEVRGLHAVEVARSAIGLAMASEQNIANLHANGAKPAGVLSTDARISPEAADKLKAAFKRSYSGKNSHSTLVLDGDWKYSNIGMTAEDAETNATRSFQVLEICRAFGVFPQMIHHNEGGTNFASAEAFFAAHNVHTRAKWQTVWRQKIDQILLDGKGPLFAEFDNRPLQTANIKDTGEYFAKALGAGGAPPWMTQNEVRAERGLPPKDGGDELFKPSNAVIDDEPEDEGETDET